MIATADVIQGDLCFHSEQTPSCITTITIYICRLLSMLIVSTLLATCSAVQHWKQWICHEIVCSQEQRRRFARAISERLRRTRRVWPHSISEPSSHIVESLESSGRCQLHLMFHRPCTTFDVAYSTSCILMPRAVTESKKHVAHILQFNRGWSFAVCNDASDFLRRRRLMPDDLCNPRSCTCSSSAQAFCSEVMNLAKFTFSVSVRR